MIKASQLSEIAKTIIEKDYDFDHIGLRVQESDYGLAIGDEIEHISKVWIDGDMTDDELDGICAVSVAMAVRHHLAFGAYIGNTILVIGSNRADSGEDDGEIILRKSYGQHPVILDIIHM